MKSFISALGAILLWSLTALAPIDAAAAAADAPAVSYQDFLNVPAGDRSAALLEGVVGPVWLKVTGYNETSPVTGVDNRQVQGGLLGTISASLNTACMVLALLILMMGGAFAALSGAHSGSGASDRYHTLWVPFRSAFSFALLSQVAGGYSLIQILVMKAAFLGIGIGDATYSNVLNYINTGQPISFASPASSVTLAKQLLKSTTCMRAINSVQPGSVVPISGPPLLQETSSLLPWAASTVNGTQQFSFESALNSGLLPGPVCGTVTISASWSAESNPVDLATKAVFEGRSAAMVRLISALDAISAKIIASEQPGSAPIGSATSDPLAGAASDFQQAIADYNVAISTLASQAIAARDLAGSNAAAFQYLKEGGWLMLGTVYWAIESENAKMNQALAKDGQVGDIADPAALVATNSDIYPVFIAAMSAVDTFETKTLFALPSDQGVVEGGGRVDKKIIDGDKLVANLVGGDNHDRNAIQSWFSDGGAWAVNTFIKKVSADGDAIANLQDYGQYLFGTGVSLWTAARIGKGIGDSTKDSTVGKLLSGGAGLVGPLKWLGAGISILTDLVLALAPFMILIGIGLGFYLPFVPLFLWIINAAGWLIFFGKAMIAAPIWAAAHAIPEGEGFAGQNARQGYMLMIQLVMGPILMIAGLLLGMLMLQLAIKLSSWMFPIMMQSVMSNDMIGLLSALVLIAAYTVLVTALAHKCFALSSELRDEVLRWIGGGTENLGDHEAAGHTNRAFASISQGGKELGGSSGRPKPEGGGKGSAGEAPTKPGGSTPPATSDPALH